MIDRLRALPLLVRATGLAGRAPRSGWSEVRLGEGTAGELWPLRGRVTGPPIVLAIGVTPEGPADPRVRRLADALARTGRTVFVPRLALADRRLTYEDVDRLVQAVATLDRGRGVVAVGFSFGGAYSLIAAADPRTEGHLRAVATFGAYAELLGFLTEMRSELRDQEAVLELIAGHELVGEERDRVVAVLEGRAEVEDLPERLLALARQLSPVTYADEVDVPVVLLHATGDETVPDRELRLLADAFPQARVHTVELFTHVDLHAHPGKAVDLLRDLWTLWRFAVTVLGA